MFNFTLIHLQKMKTELWNFTYNQHNQGMTMNRLNISLILLSTTLTIGLPAFADEVDHSKMDQLSKSWQLNQTPLKTSPNTY